MSSINTITSVHVKKLGHSLDEIRLRALDSIISKFDHGFGCDCQAVKKELVIKLFNWFTFPSVPQPEKVLDLLLRLIQTNGESYLCVFEQLRFQNEIRELRRNLDSTWHDKLDRIEAAIVAANKARKSSDLEIQILKAPVSVNSFNRHHAESGTGLRYGNEILQTQDYNDSQTTITNETTLDSTEPFDLSLQFGDGTHIDKKTDGGIRWLVMPWQPLVTSDLGVLAAIEEALNNPTDTSLIQHTCQFITNVMLQDFPAEVFLQRPAIVNVLHSLIYSNGNDGETNLKNIASTVVKTLYKLTRSLRFRIHYYCDPCVANKKQKLLAENVDSIAYPSSEDRDSPDDALPEANYQAYQSAGTSERSHSITEQVDESILQLQQMTIPSFCIESLKHVIMLLSIPINPLFPLRDVKGVTDLSYELIQLLNTSILPNIWLCGDGVSLKINESLKLLLKLLGEVIEHFGNYNSMDHCRVTYLHLICMTTKLLSSVVPLEVADLVLPKPLKWAILAAVLDAPIYLMYPQLHSTLQEYARQLHGKDERECVKLFDETRLIAKSMKAAISLMNDTAKHILPDVLKQMYASKLSLPYHKNLSVIRKSVTFLQDLSECNLDPEDCSVVTKLTLGLLANGDVDIQLAMYTECHTVVVDALGVAYSKRKSWEKILFLFNPSVLIEIVSHGATNENDEIRNLAEEILVYLLKGRVQMGENGWATFIEALAPSLPLLQCLTHPTTTLGQCVTKMLDPDLASSIQLPYIEVLRGNARLLFAPDSDIREEAVCRLIWLLGKEKDSAQKLPRLSSLNGLPLSSLCIFERQTTFKNPQGTYQRSSLLSVLEMLNGPGVEPKMRKSALVQISVMLTNTSLHDAFVTEDGLKLILEIFNSALIEKEYENYPDSVIPILTILNLICSTDSTVRYQLSVRTDVYSNILRSLFLFPNNESVKTDASHLLCLLLYSEYIMKLGDKEAYKPNKSLPYIVVARMRLPFVSKTHWKTSIHRRSDVSVLHSANETALTFLRHFWAWEWNNGRDVLWKNLDSINDSQISEKLKIRESEFACLQYSSPNYCCQQQLFNIQNSTTHGSVTCALDFLTMYMKLCDITKCTEMEGIIPLKWEQTFERFLLSQPTCKEDCDLFVNVLSFLYGFVNITKYVSQGGDNEWLCKIMKNMTKSLSDLLRSLDTNNQDVHQSVLKLARACSAREQLDESDKSVSKDTSWIHFIELVVSNLCFGDQQHFYNLAYLDWLLTCLLYLIGKCRWNNHRNLLISLGNALIELIISFNGAGTVSYMGLSITRNSIICLNHLLYQMEIFLNKNTWTDFWYEKGRCLSWLPMLWRNRDPLVRASALQLLAGLTTTHHTALQLLNVVTIAPSELCLTLLDCIINRGESCLVREQAAAALSNIIRNCECSAYQYADSLKPEAILIYAEQSNIYYEISVLCASIYMLSTLDPDLSKSCNEEYVKTQSEPSGISVCVSLVPKQVSYLYNCHDELQLLSIKDSEMTEEDNDPHFIATPSLVTAICTFLSNLISIGQHNVIRQIYEHSLDKYFFRCFNGVPQNIEDRKSLILYCDILEMYTSLCVVLTKCVTLCIASNAAASFAPDSLYLLFSLLNHELYYTHTPRLVYLRNRLWTEIYKLLAVLSITESQNSEALLTALNLCGPQMVIASICIAIKNTTSELQMSAIGSLASLLSQEVRSSVTLERSSSIQIVLDTSRTSVSDSHKETDLHDVISSVNKLSIRNLNMHTKKLNGNEEEMKTINDCDKSEGKEKFATVGSEICKTLLQLYIAHGYAKSKKNQKQFEDKVLITVALTNLLCISREAKQTALKEDLVGTSLLQLKELYVKLHLQPLELHKVQSEEKTNPLLHDVNRIVILLTNFMHNDVKIKEAMAKAGLADVLHKLWVWISLSKLVIISALKLLETFTTNCPEAAKSLTLTTTLPGVGPRKTPNTVALIHVMVHLASKGIEKAGHRFENNKLHCAFHILRNAVRNHECRVLISKSNLLQLFSKIHPVSTKRAKPWPIVEIYCLEFLIDFTFYEEGQISVSKATDGIDVLIHLARCSSSSTRILAISILRNLAFNVANRSRFLNSADFINLLHNTFRNGPLGEIGVAGSTLWSLVSNNQQGKLIARNAGFPETMKEVLGRLTLLSEPDAKQEKELIKMLEYVIKILSTSENSTHDN